MSTKRVASELTVAILPLGKVSPIQIDFTVLVLKHEFGVKIMVMEPMEIPAEYFNAERGRYQAQQILDFLFFQLPANAQRIMGIAEGDLENTNNKLRFGFGSQYNRVALYRVPRLSEQESDPIKKGLDQNVISYDLIFHEFCHTLGLNHCDRDDCAMNIVPGSVALCAHCRRWADRELRVQPGSAEERFSFAESLLTYNCFTQAIAVYREAIYRAPHEPLYHSGLAKAMFKVGQRDAALQELKLAAELANDGPDLCYSFGIAFLNSQLELAEKYFAKAIANAKNPQSMQRFVGQAYREIRRDVERASRHYKEYLRLGGNDQDVIDWLVSRSKLNNS